MKTVDSKVRRMCLEAVVNDTVDKSARLRALKLAAISEISAASSLAELKKATKQAVRVIFKAINAKA